MSQSADIQHLPLEEILQILRNQALSMPTSSTSSRYLQALQSFASSLTNTAQSADTEPTAPTLRAPLADTARSADTEPTAPTLRAPLADTARSADTEPTAPTLRAPLANWLVSQWLTNTPFSTASLYLDIISSLYGSAVKQSLLPKTNLFSQLKAELKALGPQGWKSGIDDEIFDRALRLTKNASHLLADDHTAAQLVIHSLTHGLLPLSQVAMLKKSDLLDKSDKSESSDKSDNHSKFKIQNSKLKKPRYLYPLRQSQRTPKQLQAHITKIVNALFKRARLPQSTDPNETIESLWAYAALRTGIPATTVVSHLGHAPLGLPILKLAASRYQTPDTRSQVISLSPHPSGLWPLASDLSAVGKIFLENPPQWYAMSLRPGTRFTQLCARLEQLRDCSLFTTHYSLDIDLFYPSEEIARAIGKKIVIKQRPFIHSVVFFRAKLTDIGRLFARIGDLAWCYRQSARPGSPYAHINDAQFRLFQQTIAQFTPDYEVAPIGELELREGDQVQILGGLFTGQTATVVGTHGPCVRPSEKERKQACSACVQESPLGSKHAPHASHADTTPNTARSADTEPKAPKLQAPLADTAAKANASGVIYRLNIVGDNGIEWRISVDPRLLKAT